MTSKRPTKMPLDKFLKNPEAKPKATTTTTNRSVSHTDDDTAERRSAAHVTRTDRGGMFGTAQGRGRSGSAEKYDPDYDRSSLSRGRGGPR